MAIKIHGVADPVQCTNYIRDIWMITWNKETDEEGNSSYLSENFEHKPSLAEIKEVILSWFNAEIDKEILTGFTWKEIPVWLSMENQFNYKAAYDIAVQSNGETLPTFKLGTTDNPVYYKFESLDDLKDFYFKALVFINETLSKGWEAKDAVNWEEYSELLK
jgi:hypothetical protein